MSSFWSLKQRLPPPASSSAIPAAAAAAASPQWMLLAPYAGGRYKEDCNATGDSETIAAAATSGGDLIIVSLRRDPVSPAPSRICLRYVPSSFTAAVYRHTAIWARSTVVAAHGGSALLRIVSTGSRAVDYFLYNTAAFAAAGDAAGDNPALYLLPAPPRQLDVSATGLLCRGDADGEEFVVAELNVVESKKHDTAAAEIFIVAFELSVFRFRHGEWRVKRRPRIVVHGGSRRRQLVLRGASWETVAVVPLGNGNGNGTTTMLCWVGQHGGVIVIVFSDDGGPSRLRYVEYPAEAEAVAPHGWPERERLVCAGVDGELKLVSMAPHRCPHCGCSAHATAFDVWTLNTDDDMAWVLEAGGRTSLVIDSAAELWALPNMPGYARVHLVYPLTTTSVNKNGGGGNVVASLKNCGNDDVVSGESAAAPTTMEEEDEQMRQSVSTTRSASDAGGQQQQGDNGLATVGRWPKRRRRANSMVTGPEWIA